MIIKKHKNGNEYFLSKYKFWIRNPNKKNCINVNINNMHSNEDIKLILENEIENNKKKFPTINSENIVHRKICIISDSIEFESKKELINKMLEEKITFMGINGILNKWDFKKSLNYYVINNPYKESLHFLPNKKIHPKCIASIRTNHEFLDNYNGLIYKYYPAAEENYSYYIPDEIDYQIDDYRNPLIACLNLSYKFQANKVLFLCCGNYFNENRPNSIKFDENMYMYEQQLIANDLLDSNLHWLSNKIDVKNNSKGLELKNCSYINEEDILNYFKD